MECALRELREETGIRKQQLKVDPEFCYESRYLVNGKRYGGDGEVEKTLRIYLAWLLEDVKIKVTEHNGYEWFDWAPPHQIQTKAIDPLLDCVNQHLTNTDRK